MTRFVNVRRRMRPILALASVVAFGIGLSDQAALASTTTATASTAAFETLNGSGSSWAAPAIDAWSADVRNRGIVVNFAPNGSQQGRSDYIAGLKQFAASDIAFLNGEDKIAGGVVENVATGPGYSYVPITAGGTAFMYHLTVAGKQVTNMRLSGDTITKIFTGQITNWSDPQITKDYGSQLPSKAIVPVIRSDGSGATAQFTAWMNSQYSSQWDAFCAKYAHVNDKPCGETEFYPSFDNAKSQGSSAAVANYITSSVGEGSIGYDEYAYAKLANNYPVVKVLNPAGYYTLPTAANVAVALTKAQINFDETSINYLTQDLSQVYTNSDPRSYPLSSYSYLIIPRVAAGKPDKPDWKPGYGATMSAFADYFLCAGQSEMSGLGYSPLPLNLVQGAFKQITAMPYAQPTPASQNLDACGNETFQGGRNVLLETAPQPSDCDKVNSPLICGTGLADPTANKPKDAPGAGTTATNAASGDTAKVGSNADTTAGSEGLPAQAVTVRAVSNTRWLPSVATGLLLLAIVALPPVLNLFVRRRRT